MKNVRSMSVSDNDLLHDSYKEQSLKTKSGTKDNENSQCYAKEQKKIYEIGQESFQLKWELKGHVERIKYVRWTRTDKMVAKSK